MDPKQAVQVLDQAVAALTANRETHYKLQQAIQAVMALLPKEEAPKAE